MWLREQMLSLLDTAIRSAHPENCLPRHLPAPPRAGAGRLIVLATGKAAPAMVRASERHYRNLGAIERMEGFATTRHGWALATERIELVEAGHPIPDLASVRAGERALEFANEARAGDLVLLLLSGGASALWSVPVRGVDLAAKQAVTRALLATGARIDEINTVRKHLSRIKGGRLARAVAPARLMTLAISDVPGDDPAAIGSGPGVGDPTSLADARCVLARYAITPPPGVAAALADAANETPAADAPFLADNSYDLVATPAMSLEAAARRARDLGYRVRMLGDALEGEARVLAREHAQLALEIARTGVGVEPVALLSGGEATVTLKGRGRGGPNQEYALALALALDGASGITALAADTDGTDGGSGAVDDPAGAMVWPDTLARARELGLNGVNFLEDNDSGGFFGALGDLIVSGPTQTNVNDFRAILIGSGSH